VVLQLGVGRRVKLLTVKETAGYELLHRASELVGSSEYGNEPSGSTKGREFFD